MVDAEVLKASVFGRVGSTPSLRTIYRGSVAVAQGAHNPLVAGANPASDTMGSWHSGLVHFTVTEDIEGSNPFGPAECGWKAKHT